MSTADDARAALLAAGRAIERAAKDHGVDSREVGVAREKRAVAQRVYDQVTALAETVAVADLAARLWGEEWVQPLADFAGVNVRTCERIREAALTREGYQAARGVLRAFSEAVGALNGSVLAIRQRIDDENGRATS